MPTFIERVWDPDGDVGQLGRKDRAPGRYLAYVPDELGALRGSEMRRATAEDALAVLARADERIGSRAAYLNHLLIRSESISSSWIEGNRVTPKRLAIAEALEQGPRVALDVIGNVRATEDAIAALADRARPITTADIEDLQHVIEPSLQRGLRAEQNWVGGTGWSPLRAEFVPPPETEVPRLVADLAAVRHGNLRQPCRARRDRARAVRDDPPVHRRQRPHRSCPHSHGAASRRRAAQRADPDQHRVRRRHRHVHRGSHRLPRRSAADR